MSDVLMMFGMSSKWCHIVGQMVNPFFHPGSCCLALSVPTWIENSQCLTTFNMNHACQGNSRLCPIPSTRVQIDHATPMGTFSVRLVNDSDHYKCCLDRRVLTLSSHNNKMRKWCKIDAVTLITTMYTDVAKGGEQGGHAPSRWSESKKKGKGLF